MSESYHTSRMRETCTSGSQEGRGETVIGTAFQSVLPAYSTVEVLGFGMTEVNCAELH
jgi:hypothetical protein